MYSSNEYLLFLIYIFLSAYMCIVMFSAQYDANTAAHIYAASTYIQEILRTATWIVSMLI